jgi:Ni/Co efflux regulator RcnB
MRILVAVLAVAVVAGPAHAQDFRGAKGRGSQQSAEPQKNDPKKKKAIEEGYQSGIRRIPDPKEKYDPWKIAR